MRNVVFKCRKKRPPDIIFCAYVFRQIGYQLNKSMYMCTQYYVDYI